MNVANLTLRPGGIGDLTAINAVVARAVMTWDLPERVKRLALPLYRYGELDLDVMQTLVADEAGAGIVGVAAWECADPAEVPVADSALLLHGLYVDPSRHGRGIGSRLLQAAELAVRTEAKGGLLVKAQRDAEAFFLRRGLERLGVEDRRRDYPNRLWKPVLAAPCPSD